VWGVGKMELKKMERIASVLIIVFAIIIGAGCTEDATTSEYQTFHVIEEGNVFMKELTGSVSNIEINSDEFVNIYIMDDEYEYQRYVDRDDFVHYPRYEASEVLNYNRDVTFDTEGKVLVIHNLDDFGVGKSANIEIILTLDILK